MQRITPVTTKSISLDETRLKVLNLYRKCLKSAPKIIKNYSLHFTTQEVRQKFRKEFDQYKRVSDPNIIDLLVFKGLHELEETVLMWKTRSHALRYFTPVKKETWLPEGLVDEGLILQNKLDHVSDPTGNNSSEKFH